MNYRKVSILGVGLIGGAIGIALKKKKLAGEVWGWGRNKKRLKEAVSKKACDKTTKEIEQAVKGSDIVILSTPPEIIIKQIKEIKPYISDDSLIMDVGSVKTRIVDTARSEISNNFVGCHPMTGSEKTGVVNASGGMFENAPCIITPNGNPPKMRLEKAKNFWEDLGCRIVVMDSREHDLMVAFTSHLPHAISSALACTFSEKLRNADSVNEIAGPSFRDMTRIAGASAVMWAQIYGENKENVLYALDSFEKKLKKFKNHVKHLNKSKMKKFIQKGSSYKNKI